MNAILKGFRINTSSTTPDKEVKEEEKKEEESQKTGESQKENTPSNFQGTLKPLSPIIARSIPGATTPLSSVSPRNLGENPNILMKEKIDKKGLYSLVVLRRLKASSYTEYES